MAGTAADVVVKTVIRPYTAVCFEPCDIRRSAKDQGDNQGDFAIVAQKLSVGFDARPLRFGALFQHAGPGSGRFARQGTPATSESIAKKDTQRCGMANTGLPKPGIRAEYCLVRDALFFAAANNAG